MGERGGGGRVERYMEKDRKEVRLTYNMLFQVIPVPEIPSDALRQAFIDHGRGQGIQLNEVPPEVPTNQVGCSVYSH